MKSYKGDKMSYKTLQEVPLKDLELYYGQIEYILGLTAFEDAVKLYTPFTLEFDTLQLKLFDEYVEEAMIRQFIGVS
jgi:hypothetical protein